MNHVYISMAVFLIGVACSLLVLSSEIKWWKKLFIVVALCGTGTLSYRLMNELYGLPTLLQEDFDDILVLGYYPDRENNALYLWLKEDGQETPISYKMIYSERLHKQLEKNREQSGGKPYRGSVQSQAYPLEMFSESIDDIDVQMLPVLPPKRKGQ